MLQMSLFLKSGNDKRVSDTVQGKNVSQDSHKHFYDDENFW